MIQNIMPISWLLPGVAHRFDPANAIRDLTGMPRGLLLIGQMGSDGQATAEETVRVTSEPEALDLVSEGSMLIEMYRFARKNAGRALPIYFLPLDEDASGNKAVGTFTVGGTPTANGTFYIYINGQRMSVRVVATDTAADIASKIKDAIDALPSLPLTAEINGSDDKIVDLTCNWKGETGNYIDLRVNHNTGEYLSAGITVTAGDMASGSGNPDITSALAAIASERFSKWVFPYTDTSNLSLLENDLDLRWGPENMLDGRAFISLRGTVGALGTFADNRNNHQIVCLPSQGMMDSPWAFSSASAAVFEKQMAVDPSVPVTGDKVLGIRAPKESDLFSPEQRNILLGDGIATWTANNGDVFLERTVTMYTETPQGSPDQSYREANWVETLSYYRWFVVNEFRKRINEGFKLAEYIEEPVPGQKIMTKEFAEEEMLRIYNLFERATLLQNYDHYQDTILVEIDGAQGRVKIQDEPLLVTQFYQAEVTSQYIAGRL